MSHFFKQIVFLGLFSLLGPPKQAFLFADTSKKNQSAVHYISGEFIWEGDFSGTYSFNGKPGELIKTQTIKSNQNCDIELRSLFVTYKKSEHIKFNLFLLCSESGKNLKITLEPIYVNLKNLSSAIKITLFLKNIKKTALKFLNSNTNSIKLNEF